MHDYSLVADSVWELLQRRVAVSPSSPMLIEPSGRTWSFAEAAARAESLAAGLHAKGISAGTKVTWQFPTSTEAVFLALALARLGAIQSPVIHLYRKKEVLAILRQNRSAFFIVPAACEADRNYVEFGQSVLTEIPAPPRMIWLDGACYAADSSLLPPPATPGESATWVYYTSGTTSDPKGACHTDATLIASGRALACALGIGPQDIGSITFPFAHVGGLMYSVMLLVSGMAALVLPKFVPEEAITLFRQFGVTASGGSTAHYQAFLAQQRRQPETRLVPSLSLLSGGGAAKPPELFLQARREMGCTIAHSYGMTEAPMIAGGSPLHTEEQLAYSDGAPVAGMVIRIVDDDGTPARVGESGEIRIKGPTVCKGYTDPALTAEAFDEHGFFRTGDVGMLREDGHLAITGRLKDVIIRKGENVSAREIEDVLFQHPKVSAVAVIGLPDAERGERVCAVVELRDPDAPLAFSEMVQFFEAAGTMRQKIPEQLEIVDRLPRNATFNKILKFKLREQFSTPARQTSEVVT